MPPFGSVKRKELLRYLQQLGFSGPYSGGKHQFMVKGNLSIHVPNPHQGDIGRDLLLRILRQAGISKEIWERL